MKLINRVIVCHVGMCRCNFSCSFILAFAPFFLSASFCYRADHKAYFGPMSKHACQFSIGEGKWDYTRE